MLARVFRIRMFFGVDCIFSYLFDVSRSSPVVRGQFRFPVAKLPGHLCFGCGKLASLVGICEMLFRLRLLLAILLDVLLLSIGWCFHLVLALFRLSLVRSLVFVFYCFWIEGSSSSSCSQVNFVDGVVFNFFLDIAEPNV